MQWITVAKIQRNFFVFKTFLAGIMILYLLTWRASSAGDGTETLSFRYWCGDLEVESVMIVVLYSSDDIHFSDCSSLLHVIIQQTQITILL